MSSKKSSSRKSGLAGAVILLGVAASLGGCADYVKHRDTITLHAGDAQAWNRVVHATDPWPPYVMDNQIPGDGQRTAVVIQRYSTGNAQGSPGGAPPSPGDMGAAPQ